MQTIRKISYIRVRKISNTNWDKLDLRSWKKAPNTHTRTHALSLFLSLSFSLVQRKSWQLSYKLRLLAISKPIAGTDSSSQEGSLQGVKWAKTIESETWIFAFALAPFESFILPSLFSSSVDLADCSFALGCFAAIKIRSCHRILSFFLLPFSKYLPLNSTFSFLLSVFLS